ncbi:MAG TPA: Ig-like domain-containing protein [Verrucomicrobiae bacterium]
MFFLLCNALQAQLIDVDFNNDSYGSAHGGPSVGPTMSGAAFLGAAGDQWNGISVSSGSGISLIYATGGNSPVTMTFASGGGYDANAFAGATPFASTPYDALMEDYLFNGGSARTITLSGLATNATYDLVLYNAADNSAGAVGRTTSFTVNGNTQSSVWNASSSTLIAGVDYVEFASAQSDGSGNLAITYNGSPEGDIDGFQIAGKATVKITSPTNGAVFIGTPVNVNIGATASGGFGPATNVQFFLNGILSGTDQVAPFNLTASNLMAGAYALTAVATAAGISMTSSVVTISVLNPISQVNNSIAYSWTTIAGYPGEGSADGVGGAAEFNSPVGVAVDSAGNVYVTDQFNEMIRKITPSGLVSTIAGLAEISGNTDGAGSAARFNLPTGLAMDTNGNLYVADQFNETIRKITPVGTNWMVSTIAGSVGGSADGTNSAAQFSGPHGLAVDRAGNIYVADYFNDTIRKITPSGTNWVVTTIAGSAGNSGHADGTNGASQFSLPTGITADSAGNLYVADLGNYTIRKITPVGTNWVVTTIAGTAGRYGDVDATNNLAAFYYPSDVTVDSATNIYVSDRVRDKIRKITPSGTNWVVTSFVGSGGNAGSADGTGSSALFNWPSGSAIDNAGNLYIADTLNNTMRKVTPAAVVSTIAGSAGGSSGADGVGSTARFNGPLDVSINDAGFLLVADSGNDTVRNVTFLGQVGTVAGLAGNSGSTNGAGSNARFNYPAGIVADTNGNVYVVDADNDTIRKITPAGVATTIAGSAGIYGFADGTNGAAQFNFGFNHQGIAMDKAGNLYVVDGFNEIIRKITPSGTNWVVSTIAGSLNNSGLIDGIGTNAMFNNPTGVAVDGSGNLYVTDSGTGFSGAIRKITPMGANWVVQTIAGDFIFRVGNSYSLGAPQGVSVDNAGNLFVTVADSVLEINQMGTNWVLNVIGGEGEGSADGAGSAALFNQPYGITVDNSGAIYVADTDNNTIRKGVFTAYGQANTSISSASGANGTLSVTLLPPEAGGQWRFGWETGWRASGTTARNLVAGNYPVQFSSVSGYLTIQTNFIAVVPANTAVYMTNQYYPTLNGGAGSVGSLTVDITPSVLSGTGWRFLGETTWRAPGSTAINLLPGIYNIEFEPVSGYVKPSTEGIQVSAGVPAFVTEGYLLASTAPSGVLLPFPVPGNEIGDVADYPFGFNGQLQSDADVGYGSGVAVQTNVVLTAAHMVFNDQTLSYASQVFWYFEEETGASALQPQSARGWYVLSGYAAQRTNDIFGGLAPDQSSPQSRDFDVAALYFLSPVAGGGYNGYLPSDASPNPWLTGNGLKMLVGYPVDGSEFGDASIVPGEMYQTTPQPYPLSLATDPVNDQQVYTANWFLSYPGNSGGPLYVQYNGYYYPAGVYVGTLYNGVTPYASAVRAIDSAVVNLITNAAVVGDNGVNHPGGGVVTIVPSQATSASHPGYLQFLLGPAGALAAGAAWELQGDAAYSTATNYVRLIATTNAVAVQFKPISGWSLPTNQMVAIVPGQITTYSAQYLVNNPMMVVSGNSIGLTGTTGTVYRIEGTTSLVNGSWIPISTNTIISGGVNVVLPRSSTNATMFYRAVWLQ